MMIAVGGTTHLQPVWADSGSASQPPDPDPRTSASSQPSGLFDGHGDSYWGPIAPAADSISTAIQNTPRPLWEYPFLVPYRVVEAPLRLTWNFAGASYFFLQRYGVVDRIGRLLGPRDLPYGFLLSFKAGDASGVGGGLTFYHNSFLGPDNRFKVRTLYTSQGTRRAVVGLLVGDGHDVYLDSGSGYTLRQAVRYFGLGPDAGGEDSHFAQETSWIGGTLGRHLGHDLLGEFTVVYSAAGTRRPHPDEDPALQDVLPANELPLGYGELSTGVTLNLGFAHDAARENGRPETGGVRRIEASYFGGTGDETASYWGYRADLEQFIPLWWTERALALRGYTGYLDAEESEIPFQRLYTNDEPDQLRGFSDFRWRDRGMAVLSTEYRWPIWTLDALGGTGVDAYLLNDVGQVFHDVDQISRKNVTISWGGGLRMISNSGFTGRIELARSAEETVFRISTDQLFQYDKGDLYNGRDQGILR